IMEREKVINSMQRSITNYLVALSRESLLNDSEHKEIDDLLYMINDIERVGDHIKNICELYEDIENDEIIFSQDGLEELGHMFDACENVFETAIEAFVEKDEGLAQKAFDIEDSVDQMEETYRQNHIRRLANKYVDAAPGIVFLDCISNLERISDHSNNIASYVVNKES
ncbi:MAG: PhoU domain-containing protein, partial [Ezakiella massiliensis]